MPMSGQDDIRNEIRDISKKQTEMIVEQRVQNTAFSEHKVQNEKDFNHIGDDIHRTDSDSRARDENIVSIVKEIRDQFDEVRAMVWKACGALLVIVPVINFLVDKVFK